MVFFFAFKFYCIESCGENTDRSSEILTAMAQYTEASTSRGGHTQFKDKEKFERHYKLQCPHGEEGCLLTS